MKQVKIITVAFAVLVVCSSASLTGAADGKLDQILANMQQTAKKIDKVRARLHQEKLSKAIGPPPEVYNGDLFFRHDRKGSDKVKINYVNSRRELVQALAVVGDDITLYQPQIKQAIKTTRQRASGKSDELAFIASPYKSVPELKSQYNISYKGDEQVGSTPTSVLELTPKGKSAAKKVTLWVNQSDWFPIKYQLIERNDDVSTFLLSDVRLGGAMPDSVFKIDLPSDTKIVKR